VDNTENVTSDHLKAGVYYICTGTDKSYTYRYTVSYLASLFSDGYVAFYPRHLR
jgi:hypothetical protein